MLLCARYVLPITAPVIQNGAVLVRDGRICDVGTAQKLRLLYPDEERVAYESAALMPGLVNLQANLENVALRGLINDVPFTTWLSKLTEKNLQMEHADLFDSAMVGCLDALSSGITCVADVSSTGAVFEAAKTVGMRSVIFRRVAAMDKDRVDFAMRGAVKDVEAWQETIAASDKPDLHKVGLFPAPIFTTHPAVYTRVAEYATEHDVPVIMRLAGSREEANFVRYGSSAFAVDTMDDMRGYVELPPWLPTGVSPVQYVLNWDGFEAPNVIAIDVVYVDDRDIRTLREFDVAICHCPRANAQLGKGVAPLDELLRDHLRIGLGTDSPAATNSIDMFTEMRIGMLLQRAVNRRRFLDTATMLELATIGGASVLGLADEIGSLEIGKRADIIAVDLSSSHQAPTTNPVSAVVNTCTSADVLMTMIDGERLYEKNHWQLELEVARHIARVIEIRSKLRV